MQRLPIVPLATLAAVCIVGPASADVKLPAIFSDHMVLQRGVSASIWGAADPGERVTVAIAGKTQSVETGADGNWKLKLEPITGAGPHTLTVTGKNTLTIQDVLAGEVWLGSGQSNMAMAVNRAKDFGQEQAAATFPRIRMFTVARRAAREPQADCRGTWEVCTPETVGRFSATAYFFGRELHRKLGAPVGLINSSVGGTPIEAWTSLERQKELPELKPLLTAWDQRAAAYHPETALARYEKLRAAHPEAVKRARDAGKRAPRAPQRPVHPHDDTHAPATLFNGMIAPLAPYSIRGVLWYQGENNGRNEESGALYAAQLPLLVRDWRARWGRDDLPFAWVQLPNFRTNASGWPLVREAMLKSLSLSNTGMTVNMDIGEENDIHPKNKQEIGRRLSLWARATVYGEKLTWSGPLAVSGVARQGALAVRFQHADGGLAARDGELRGFELAGPDGKWRPAAAAVEGGFVVVRSPEVPDPVAVRYSWAAYPDGNLVNKAGLPASPFRLDNQR